MNNQLPVFTQVISVQVPVASIYDKLLAEFPEDYKHRETVAHAIIGTAMRGTGISFIYNALAGFTNEVNFQIGETVVCDEKERYESYDPEVEDENGFIMIPEVKDAITAKPKLKTRRVAIGNCKIVDIDMYSDKQLRVEFSSVNRYSSDGKAAFTTEWVNMSSCTKIADRVH